MPAAARRHAILVRMSKKEAEFEKLARLIKEEGEDIRRDVHEQIGAVQDEIGGLRTEMRDGFAAVNRRLDQIIQTQLDEHATRLKKLEAAVFSK
jgi:vacuolar-type H+-ATPase subunit E/Vma4